MTYAMIYANARYVMLMFFLVFVCVFFFGPWFRYRLGQIHWHEAADLHMLFYAVQILALFAASGYTLVTSRLGKVLPVLLASALVVGQIGANYDERDESNNYYVRNFGRALLEHLPQNSILLVYVCTLLLPTCPPALLTSCHKLHPPGVRLHASPRPPSCPPAHLLTRIAVLLSRTLHICRTFTLLVAYHLQRIVCRPPIVCLPPIYNLLSASHLNDVTVSVGSAGRCLATLCLYLDP